MSRQYAIGIDLGTTNSVVAYADLGAEQTGVRLLEIPQVVDAATVEARTALPSFLTLAGREERESGALDLPWKQQPARSAGDWARRRSADTPERTVSAAKSWLCHPRVDRTGEILPWNAPDEGEKISPLEAGRHYLAHMIAAWNHAMPEAPFADQQVVLTVPASFDAGARELTRQAALAAGLPEDFVLLEEPQAAVYAWLHKRGEDWRRDVGAGDRLLVCDIGGGTTDFSLVGVDDEDGDLVLNRLAVGNHILVGGDNMDLALAHHAQQVFAEKGVDVDAWQAVGLWHACRAAKEGLLREDGPDTLPVSVLGRGSKLVGGTISAEIERRAALDLLLEGFFPPCGLQDRPARHRASGFQQMGLAYESDPAITRHLARFLHMHAAGGEGVRPTHVLFNGGVLKADAFRSRLLEVLGPWFDGGAIAALDGAEDLDHAVATGAAYYGAAKQGRGIRIRGGTARSYYVGIETAGLAVPGAPRPVYALCVAPFGMEEGSETDVPSEEIGLVVGEPARFRFFSSTTRQDDRPGTVLSRWSDDELQETDPVEATLPASEGVEGEFVPVKFQSGVTELGMLELWCAGTVSDDRWKLEFQVREQPDERG